MGKCLSCFRVDPIPEQQESQIQSPSYSQQNNQTPRLTFQLICGNHHTAIRTTSAPPDWKSSKEVTLSRHSLSLRESNSPFILSSSETNGKNTVLEMPEKRSFYARIPPLSKSSCESRRASKEVSEAKLNTFFESYKDPHADAILAEGIIRLCSDLDVKPDDFRILLLAWKLKAETMCRFTREEFVQGCRTLKADSVKLIQARFPEMLVEVQNPEKFKDLYRFSYKFGLDSDTGQRILPVDMAILLWKLVFSQNVPNILDDWISFLEKHHSIRGIPRDTWYMFLNFTETVANDLSAYDDTEAWPSLLDDFVEYENDKLNQNISKDEKHDY